MRPVRLTMSVEKGWPPLPPVHGCLHFGAWLRTTVLRNLNPTCSRAHMGSGTQDCSPCSTTWDTGKQRAPTHPRAKKAVRRRG